MAAPQYIYGDAAPVQAPILSAQVADVGDMIGLSSGNAVRAADQAWNTSEAQTRQDFVALFLGFSAQKKRSTDTKPYGNSLAVLRVDTNGFFEADLDTATTLVVGDLVGPAKDTGNNLLSQTVKKVTAENEAVGTVVEAGTSLTRCKFRLRSTKVLASK